MLVVEMTRLLTTETPLNIFGEKERKYSKYARQHSNKGMLNPKKRIEETNSFHTK